MKTTLSTIPSVFVLVGVLLGGIGTNSPTYAQASSSMSYPSGDRSPEVLPEVLEALREHDRYSVLISALERTGIAQGLRISPSFTLLAPTDSAFAALDVRLSELDSYEVAELLRNHVIQKALTVRQLTAFSQVENTRGLSLEVGPGATTVGGATLVEPNVAIENGIVHGIDTVLRTETEAAPTSSLERSHSQRSLRDVVDVDGFRPQLLRWPRSTGVEAGAAGHSYGSKFSMNITSLSSWEMCVYAKIPPSGPTAIC